jgi:hypothetical protein
VVSESGSCLIASRSKSTIRIYKLMCDGYLQLSWRTVNPRWSLRESIEELLQKQFWSVYEEEGSFCSGGKELCRVEERRSTGEVSDAMSWHGESIAVCSRQTP